MEKHESNSKDSKPAKQKIYWKILFAESENKRIRKVLVASKIVKKKTKCKPI